MITFIAITLGLCPLLLKKLPNSDIEKLKNLTGLLILISVLSATLGTLSFSQVIDFNIVSGGLFWLSWALVIFAIDRALLNIMNSEAGKWLRIGIGLCFGLIHGVLLDGLIFKADVDLAFAEDKKFKELGLRESLVANNKPYQAEIKKLQGDISMKEDLVRGWRKTIMDEIDGNAASGKEGCGGICEEKIKLFKADSTQLYSEIATLNEQIKSKQNSIASNDSISNHAIASLPDLTKEAGLKNRLDKAHEVLFTNGSFATKMIALCIFFLSLFFELSIVLFKNFLGISEYFVVKKKSDEHHNKLNDTIDENDLTLALQKEAGRLVRESNRINSQYAMDNLQSKLDDLKNETAIVHKEFDSYDQELTSVLKEKNHFKDEKLEHIKRSVEKISQL
jgi:hypothetical protein